MSPDLAYRRLVNVRAGLRLREVGHTDFDLWEYELAGWTYHPEGRRHE